MWIVYLIVNIIVFMYTIYAASSKKSNIVHNIQSIFFLLRKQMNLSIVSYRKLGINSVPYVNATKVAALIGRNVFEPKEKAFLDFLKNANPQFSPLTSHSCPCDTWQEYILRKNQCKTMSDRFADTLKGDISSSFSLSTSLLVKSELVEKGAELEDVIKDQAVQASRARSDTEVKEILKETEAKVSKVAKEMQECIGGDLHTDTNFVKETVLSSTKAVVMSRGNLLEDSALNKMEEEVINLTNSKAKRNISQRNSKMRYIRTNAFSVGGKIDGYDEDEDVVVEVKNRIRKTASCCTPYDSEIVQVRLYMKMMRLEGKECNAAIIREVFPDGSTKSTTVDWSEEEWKKIQDGLLLFCEEYAKLDVVKVDELIVLVSARMEGK